jgi:hypothetical protein
MNDRRQNIYERIGWMRMLACYEVGEREYGNMEYGIYMGGQEEKKAVG